MLCGCQLSKGSTIEQQLQLWQFCFLVCLFVDNAPVRVVSVELTELAIAAHNAADSSTQPSTAQLCSRRPLITDRNQTTFGPHLAIVSTVLYRKTKTFINHLVFKTLQNQNPTKPSKLREIAGYDVSMEKKVLFMHDSNEESQKSKF